MKYKYIKTYKFIMILKKKQLHWSLLEITRAHYSGKRGRGVNQTYPMFFVGNFISKLSNASWDRKL